MNALLSLEPRMASDDTIEPEIDFADHRDELHGLAARCEVGTTTYHCENTTRICVA